MTIKVGELALVKTTNEPVFVLEIAADEKSPLPSKMGATVRIPVVMRDGIDHRVVNFYLEELESSEDFTRRQVDELQNRKKITQEGLFDMPTPVSDKVELLQ